MYKRIVMPTFAALDFETATYQRNSACALAVVKVADGQVAESFSTLIRPPTDEFRFTGIHGLTWDDVKASPTFADIFPAVDAILAGCDFLVAHNAPFDRGVFNACCTHYGMPEPGHRWSCTVRAARAAWDLPSHKLNVVCEHLGIPLDHHEALSDARACARIAIAAAEVGVQL
ncbi:MAG: 3'-5' exonuclease [Rhodospirillales bacterium]